MIVSAACCGFINDDWVVVPVHRHSDFFEIMKTLKCKYDKNTIKQGFIDWDPTTKRKTIVSREEAAKIAFACRQIPNDKEQLFSEDLW